MGRGRFITLEGGEGAGKSTQSQLIARFLTDQGKPVLQTREPGGSPGAEEIRRLLVSGAPDRWDGLTESLLFFAARRDHVQRTIMPALAAGQWVVCDRFADSTRAYQVAGHGVEAVVIDHLYQISIGDFGPDLTILLDLPVRQGLERARGRGPVEDRFERMDQSFHERLRRAFLDLAKSHADRFVVVDASMAVDMVFLKIREALVERLGVEV